MCKFKVGDKAIITDKSSAWFGFVATIIEADRHETMNKFYNYRTKCEEHRAGTELFNDGDLRELTPLDKLL